MDFPVELSQPLLQMAAELQLRPEDITEEFLRGSGHGGQKMNKTSSTVRLVHEPTGLEVRCQDHREQSKNRIAAYKHLILKIEELVKGKESKLQREAFKIRKQKARRTRRVKEKMLEDKKQRGQIKELRRDVRE
jgi:peptide chain release factor